jgi:hypothetical protein
MQEVGHFVAIFPADTAPPFVVIPFALRYPRLQ